MDAELIQFIALVVSGIGMLAVLATCIHD